MTPIERRKHAKRILLLRTQYQFTEPATTNRLCTRLQSRLNPVVTPGDVGCTDVSMALLLRIVKGRRVTMDAIRLISGAPHHLPMPTANTTLALQRLRLPYAQRLGINARALWDIVVTRGPALMAEGYWSHPRWAGATYLGKPVGAEARDPRTGQKVRVGYARPLGKAGNNQPTFTGGHMVVVAWAGYNDDGERIFGIRDSNHGSSARPARPAWDEVTMAQMQRMLRSFTTNRTSMVWVPAEEVI